MADIQELQRAVQAAIQDRNRAEAQLQVAEEELEKAKKEIKELGFSSVKELKASLQEDEELLKAKTAELEEMVKDYL